MKFPTKSNIVPVFEGIIDSILPFAESNQVTLTFYSDVKELILTYNPAHIIHDVSELLCNVIAFTPQRFNVHTRLFEIEKNNEHHLTFEVNNNGANLSRIQEITSALHNSSLSHLREPTEPFTDCFFQI